MPRDYRIHFPDSTTGQEVTLEGEFSEEAWEVLVEFVEHATALNTTQLVQGREGIAHTIRWDHEKGWSTEGRLPNDAELAEYLHRIRPFVLEGERTFFNRVCNLLAQELDHGDIRAAIQRQRDVFSGKDLQDQARFNIEDVLLNSEKSLKKWLYGYEYHKDKGKRLELEKIHGDIPLDVSRGLFISMLIDKGNAIFQIARVIQGFMEGKGATTRLPR